MSAPSQPRRRSARLNKNVSAEEEDVRMDDVSANTTVQDAVQEEEAEEHTTTTKLPVRAKGAGKAEEAPQQPETAQEEEKEDAENDDESGSDSDDDAPEAVSTAQAAQSARLMTNLAAKRREQHLNEQKRKLQARDARLKAQAAARKSKEEEEEQRQQKKEEEERAQKQDADDDADDDAGSEEDGSRAAPVAASSKKGNHLSLEFLDSDDDSDDDDDKGQTDGMDVDGRRVRRRQTAPRDRQLGGTVYRVLADRGPQTMAPKMSKQSRNHRESLLQRRRPTRPAVQGGFLRKKALPSMLEKEATMARTQRRRQRRRRAWERQEQERQQMELLE